MKQHAFGYSQKGNKRKTNQDAFFCDSKSGLYIVADGMGGMSAGGVASQAVV